MPRAGKTVERGMERRVHVRELDFYRTLLERLPNPIWRSNARAEIDFVNDAYVAFTGRDRETELGDGWMEVLHPDDRDRVEEVCYGAFLLHEPFQLEYRLRHHSGEYRWVFDNGESVFDAEGTFLGYIGSIYDIHDRVRTEEVLRRSQEELLADLDALTQLADERRRLASELVDEDGARAERLADRIENDQLQALAALNIRVELLRERLRDEMVDDLEPVAASVRETIARMRRLMAELRDGGPRPRAS